MSNNSHTESCMVQYFHLGRGMSLSNIEQRVTMKLNGKLVPN